MITRQRFFPVVVLPLLLANSIGLLLAPVTSHAKTFRVEPYVGGRTGYELPIRGDACACDSVWVGSILYKFELPGTVFTFGDTLRMVFTVTNYGTDPVTFSFGSTCQHWFALYPDSCGPGNPECSWLWRVPEGCNFWETSFTLEQGEKNEFVLDWRQHLPEGYPASPGLHTAWGALYPPYWEESLLSVPFEIVPYGPRPIQDALDAAEAGDTVLVAPGVYLENLVLLAPHNGIILKAEGPAEETVLDGGGRGSVVYAHEVGNSTIVDGFTVRGGANGPIPIAPLELGGGFSLLDGGSPTICRNIIRGNRSDWGGGIASTRYQTPHIEQNLFLDNEAMQEGGAFYIGSLSYQSVPWIEQNTFVGNRAETGGAVFDDGAYNVRVELHNNIFYRNEATDGGGALRCDEGGYFPTVNACNAFWENSPDDMTGCQDPVDPLFADPLFCAPAAEDYRLQDTSPCAPHNNPTCGLIGAYGVGCLTASAGDLDQSRVLVASPNPFVRSVDFRLSPDWTEGRADKQPRVVEIVSVEGRLIGSIPIPHGGSTVHWNGLDQQGRAVPSGIYFAQIRQGRETIGHRTLLRLE